MPIEAMKPATINSEKNKRSAERVILSLSPTVTGVERIGKAGIEGARKTERGNVYVGANEHYRNAGDERYENHEV